MTSSRPPGSRPALPRRMATRGATELHGDVGQLRFACRSGPLTTGRRTGRAAAPRTRSAGRASTADRYGTASTSTSHRRGDVDAEDRRRCRTSVDPAADAAAAAIRWRDAPQRVARAHLHERRRLGAGAVRRPLVAPADAQHDRRTSARRPGPASRPAGPPGAAARLGVRQAGGDQRAGRPRQSTCGADAPSPRCRCASPEVTALTIPSVAALQRRPVRLIANLIMSNRRSYRTLCEVSTTEATDKIEYRSACPSNRCLICGTVRTSVGTKIADGRRAGRRVKGGVQKVARSEHRAAPPRSRRGRGSDDGA